MGARRRPGRSREILARCTSVLGKDHFLTAHYAREIADLKKLAALPEAGRLEYVKTYALYDAMDGLWKKERYADALRSAEQMLAIYRHILGPHAYYTAAATSWCGQLLCYEKRYAEAEKQLREALRIYRGVLGEDDTGVARAYLFLGQVRYGQERYAEAEKELREALRIYHRLVGEDHAEVSHVYLYLAPTIEKQGRYADARPLYEANVEVSTRLRGERNGWTGVAINNLAAYLDRQAFYREAEEHRRKAVAIFRRRRRRIRIPAGHRPEQPRPQIEPSGQVRRGRGAVPGGACHPSPAEGRSATTHRPGVHEPRLQPGSPGAPHLGGNDVPQGTRPIPGRLRPGPPRRRPGP